jgi:hypothetical protein
MGLMRISGGTGVTMIKGMTMLEGRAIIRTGMSKRKKMIPAVKIFLLWVGPMGNFYFRIFDKKICGRGKLIR